MGHKVRAYALSAVAFLGLLVAVGRPLLKLHDEASWRGDFTSVFTIELSQDAGCTQLPVLSVP
jgi:hypothetical protein